MKILLINDYGTLTGGAEVQVLALRDALRKRGHDARLFTSCARSSTVFSYADYECFGTTSRFRTLLQMANPWAYWQLYRVLTDFQPDVVHVMLFLTQLSPLILPLLEGVPSLYYVVWYRPVCPLGTKMLPDTTICQVPAGVVCYCNHCLPLRDWLPLMIQMKLWWRWRKAFKLFVAISEAVKNRLTIEGIGPVEVVRPGVLVRSPSRTRAPQPTVVFVGRLVREKGVDVLIRAFTKVVAQMPEARLLIAGDGPELNSLNMLINKMGVSSHVTMLGHLSHPEMECLFDGAWVQAVPSLWAEPFGLVAVEAMMRGTAVVASDSGGLTEIVRDGEAGFLVPPGNIEALAEALLLLLKDRGLAERMGEAGHEIALAQFNETAYVDRFIHLYQTLR